MNWQALRLSLKHTGPLRLVSRYVYRGVKRCIDLDLFCLMYLPANSQCEIETADSKLEFDFFAANEIRNTLVDANSGLVIDAVEAALARKEELFGARMSQQLASYLWFAPSGAHLCQDVYVHFDTVYAYSRWAYTRDEYRGNHLHAMTKHRALSQLSQRGKLGILSAVDVGNLPSLRAAKRSGCRRVGLMLVGRIGKWRIMWASSGCRAYRVRLESLPGG